MRKKLKKVLENGGCLIEARDLDQAVEIANQFAPEHLEIMTDDPQEIFLANYCCRGNFFRVLVS